MQERTREIEFLNCSVFFGQPDQYGLDQIAVRVDSLKVRFGEHTVLKKLEGASSTQLRVELAPIWRELNILIKQCGRCSGKDNNQYQL